MTLYRHLGGARLADMVKPSPNGSDPAKGDGPTAFERFERLTRDILSVPKAEIDKRREKQPKRPRAASRSR